MDTFPVVIPSQTSTATEILNIEFHRNNKLRTRGSDSSNPERIYSFDNGLNKFSENVFLIGSNKAMLSTCPVSVHDGAGCGLCSSGGV